MSTIIRNPTGDAAVLVSAIESRHPEPFRAVDRHTLLREAARVDALDPDVPSVMAVELMRTIALLVVDESARATFRMRTRNGSVVDATLDAIATGDLLSRFGGDRGLGRPGPAYLRRRRDWHWAEVAADGHAVHVGYNVTRGDITDFALEVEALAGSSSVAVLVLDLRQNGGGDNRTYRPLLESLARLGSEKRLAVLTSRLTFSAAMQLIVELERETQAVFVGEPTGGSPNQYGDATKVELPNSGLSAFVATVAWKTAGQRDDRVTRVPDIPVHQSSTAFFAGNDPVLDAAVAALS